MTSAYAAAGVDIDAGNEAVALMRAAVQSTYTPDVLAGIGSFGGLFDAAQLRDMRAPVLVASTDGVGTKVKLAAAFGRYESIGHDIVNHCINDILVQGARPLFFLDYIAASKLDPSQVASVVKGMAEACRDAGCALLGGETAEMPGVYADGAFDVAGTIVGVVEREALLPRLNAIAPGDVLIGLASSGPHTNGYSLIRKVLADRLASAQPDDPLVDALLAPHRSYLDVVTRARAAAPIKALAHITGGGFVENIPRVLPPGLRAEIDYAAWPMPPVFALIQSAGNIGDAEMRRVFNCGIGMVMIVAPEHTNVVQAALGEPSWVIGRLEIRDERSNL
ncbi:MAG: phosphoribosylformylglycinamidine cyclo-ligase [Candidatus Roseilinea sp.]|nr:MAG: phosphoribosylformylglycinamidine cyclo-ligase [Candidatus Roseilinea sp.]